MNGLNRALPVIAGALAGGAIAFAVASGSSNDHNGTTTTVVQTGRGSSIPSSFTANRGLSVNQIFKQASPGVVDIIVTTSGNGGGLGVPGFGGGQSQGEGAGVVYDTSGNILTDEHVVDNASS